MPPEPASPLSERLRQSGALVPAFAVMAMAVVALSAALAVTRGGVQEDAPALAPRVEVAPAPLQRARSVPVRQAPQGQVPPVEVPVTVAPTPIAARTCGHCGVVESVVAVRRQERVQGIAGTSVTPGTVAGGVIGGLVGNQIGGGSGRAAATVLGAAGGAYAGHTIEKNMKTYTAYRMRIRMGDGTVRTVEQRRALAAGTRVAVQGRVARPA